MTIQEQAEVILARGRWRADNGLEADDEDDELLVRLAQDREALLKACKALVDGGVVEGCQCAECGSVRVGQDAIAQAERP